MYWTKARDLILPGILILQEMKNGFGLCDYILILIRQTKKKHDKEKYEKSKLSDE